METHQYSRRSFLKTHSMQGLAMILAPELISSLAADPDDFHFISPVDGDMLHHHDGSVTDGVLHAMIKGVGAHTKHVTVNGIEMMRNSDFFTATIALLKFENQLGLSINGGPPKQDITVYWVPRLADKYRLSIDDAIWFLRDIHEKREHYHSVFNNPFMGFLQGIHSRYGTKVHLNIFYETDGFDLSMMTSQFKNEFTGNADWLQLSFHAKAELPDDPYKHANYQQVKSECDMVIREIRRFAGDALVSPITTLHWGDVPVEVSRALRDCGYTGQLCDFNVDDHLPPCSYYLDLSQRRHINQRFLWRDTKENITFIKSSIIIDSKKLKEIIPYLDHYQKESRRPPYVDLLIHEQYFYNEYHNYQPDYGEKVETAIKWAIARGYQPAFLKECIYEEDYRISQ